FSVTKCNHHEIQLLINSKFGKMELKENSVKSKIYLAIQNFFCIVIVGPEKEGTMKSTRVVMCSITCIVLIASLTNCAGFYGKRQSRYTSSVVEYLYPKKEVVEVPAIPRLSLPLRVGVAFVPESGTGPGGSRLSEKEKMDLMDRISSEFRKLAFVKDIELIPSAYLTQGGGFTNLDQIRTMYGVDVIALLSYDQVQHTDEGKLSLFYWTIVGAYIIKGERNDTSTMIDAAVYDISSRKMLFRAPGMNRINGSSTLVNLSEQLRIDSSNGFRLASDDLVTNLQNQLDRFKNKVKEMPQEYAVEHKPGYTGGGSMGGAFAVTLLGLGGVALWRGRKV
ncbi:MAG: rhombotarget lipoprotein, partial [Anaerolineales bacterium]|nr:rhombotarget lipoprotein [Anaerolineales bacterium]